VKEDDDHETEAANFQTEADDTRELSRRKKKKKKKKKPEFKSWNSHRSSEDNLEVVYFCILHAIGVKHT
jgi:predicted component of type VI protein secretion system